MRFHRLSASYRPRAGLLRIQIGIGLNEGARQANIDIVGGETASLRGLVNALDLAGTCLGMQKKDKIITGNAIQPGDKIIGVPSSGVHSNGLSLARAVVEKYTNYNEKLKNGRTLGEELLTPTRIYHESLQVNSTCTVHGMCHITGGGLLNFKRLSPYGFMVNTPIIPPEIFSWIQKTGDISTVEMYRTFNGDLLQSRSRNRRFPRLRKTRSCRPLPHPGE